jgi:cytochrome c-type biogenesis protein CcmH
MMFWMTAALLTLCACLAVLTPVLRRQRVRHDDTAHDIEVYRDQLAEVDRDIGRGVIDAAEGEQARAEIGRRILRIATEPRQGSGGVGAGNLARAIMTVAVLLVPVTSWGVYAFTGSPDLPAQPLQARLDRDPEQATVEELIARAEGHLSANPQDGRGWDVLAPIYSRIGRHDDAAIAYRNAIRLVGATADREIGLGEALAAAGGGVIGVEAQDAFQRALVLEPQNPRARYLIANGLFQEGRTVEAADLLQTILREAPQESPWRTVAEQALASIAQPGPTADDVEAAQSMGAEDRAAMIEGMVAGLDARLRENPADPEGWQRLVHSYVTMDRRDEAMDALTRGIEALGPGSTDARDLIAFAAERGVSATE